MSGKAFFDTNILIYLYSGDEPEKRDRSRVLVAETSGVISLQVINELANVLHRKFHIEYIFIAPVVGEMKDSFLIMDVTIETVRSALALGVKYKYSYFDSLIIASAMEAGCSVIYSEDMQHGQVIEGELTIQNPFIT
jgi:predicted nucleic acid-binding protein